MRSDEREKGGGHGQDTRIIADRISVIVLMKFFTGK